MNRTDKATRWLAAAAPVALVALPVVLVNVVAFAGQLAFLRDHLPWTPAGQVLMAVTLEVIAVYLAWQAHLAQLANDSALRLRLAAYGFALLIAAMNYSHYAGPGWRPTFVAVAVALCSAASPWLWGIHTRRTSRDRLMAAGLVEPHALRLGVTRWAWHPVKSVKVMSAATWQGVTDPGVAIGVVYPPEPDRASARVSAGISVKRKLPPFGEIQARHHCGQRAAEIARAEVQLDRRSRGAAAPDLAAPAAHVPPPGPGGTTPGGASVPAGDTPPAPAGTQARAAANGGPVHG